MTQRTGKDAGIYEAGPGRFRIVVSSGKRLPNGRYEQVVRIVRGTKTDAKKARAQLIADVSRREYIPPARESLGAYLAAWIERVKPPHGAIKISTWKSYESHVRVHLLKDAISEQRVSDLTTTDVEDVFRRLLDKGLSPASIDAVRRTLRRALNQHKSLRVNPVKGADSPRVPRKALDADLLWTHEQARRWLHYTERHDADMAALVRTALDSGARLGELLALAWGDIDLKARRSGSADPSARSDCRGIQGNSGSTRRRMTKVGQSTWTPLRSRRSGRCGNGSGPRTSPTWGSSCSDVQHERASSPGGWT
jgi:integrase